MLNLESNCKPSHSAASLGNAALPRAIADGNTIGLLLSILASIWLTHDLNAIISPWLS
nr:MAG TPA: hypothetical protein [Caudoviricetes sp.]